MNLYVVLLRKATTGNNGFFRFDESELAPLLQRTGIEALDIFRVDGEFEVMLICQAHGNDAIRKLFEELDGWEATSALVRDHLGRFGTGPDIGTCLIRATKAMPLIGPFCAQRPPN
jgi:hypothetical protein